jgi:cation/acetate symporter
MVPAIFISIEMTNNPIPMLGMGDTLASNPDVYLLDRLDGLSEELGFSKYTDGSKDMQDIIAITLALMVGTAGLPHVIVRFFTVKKVKDARKSAGFALLFIAILYITAPAVSVFAKLNLMETVDQANYEDMPEWFHNWEELSLIGWTDKNNDGKIQYLGPNKGGGKAFEGNKNAPDFMLGEARGEFGQRLTSNPSDNLNELYVDRDIMVMANPEIAKLPNWVIALVAAGCLAAALSTAAGLLLVISSSVSHDLIKKMIKPDISEKGELIAARLAATVAVVIAGYFGVNPPGFVAAVVALAFGLAAASFFPAIILGIFNKRMNKQGAVAGMIVGIVLMLFYMMKFKFDLFGGGTAEDWWFGISPEGFGSVAMVVNFIVSITVSKFTPEPPQDVQDIVENIRIPSGAGEATGH